MCIYIYILHVIKKTEVILPYIFKQIVRKDAVCIRGTT